MTEEEIKVCDYYGINPMYTDVKPYVLAYRMMKLLEKLREENQFCEINDTQN